MPLWATPAVSAGGKGRHDRRVVGRPLPTPGNLVYLAGLTCGA